MLNTIFRHTFTKSCSDKLFEFVEKHQYEDRVTFKKSWKEWMIINKELIILESDILILNGYKGNVIDKMFISVRFHFKKKMLNASKNKDIQIQSPILLVVKHTSNDIMKIINEHIRINISSEISPSDLFKDFSITYINELIDIKDIKKQKKTYKNRYYIIKKSMI